MARRDLGGRYSYNGRCDFIRSNGKQCASIAQGWVGQYPGLTLYHCPRHRKEVEGQYLVRKGV